jgi:hypothetical protein
MFSSNTETNITVTYQDSDNTIDLVVDAAQPNITSLGTLTSLDVDNINLNGNTLSTSTGGLTLDVVGDIQLNADGGDITFNDGSDHIASFSNSSSNFIIKSQVQDKDILIRGNDGGSEITAVTLDMSLGGMATFLNATVSPATYNENVYITSSGTTAVNRFDNDGNDLYITYGGTSDKGLTLNNTTGMVAAKKSARIDQVAITSSSNAVAWDAAAAANAYHVTTENTTFSAPSNAVEGAIISVEIAQGGTARTIAWNTVFEFAASTAPTITATANKTDILAFRYNGSVWQEIGRVQNMAQT